MVKEFRYTSIRRVLDNLLEHPMMTDITLEQVVRYAVRFIGKHGFPRLYQDRIGRVEIHEFRGLLPCDLISIVQVRDTMTGICLRSMTDSFNPGLLPPPPNPRPCRPRADRAGVISGQYIPPIAEHHGELAFKTQGRVIFTSFPEGSVEISYKAIPVDEDGFPMLIDNENYLDALESYIKMRVFGIKFDQGRIASGVYEHAQQDYYVAARLLQSEMCIPSYSEMQSITNMVDTLIPRMSEFYKGFKELGDREFIRKH